MLSWLLVASPSRLPANKQLQRTVIPQHVRAASASFHYALAARWTRGHAAAELQRYAALGVCRGPCGLKVPNSSSICDKNQAQHMR